MADDLSPIHDLVGHLQEEASTPGGDQDSGSFSLDLNQAARSLGERENRPGLYLLKLVQAVVAAGGSHIKIGLGRSRVDFEASGPRLFSRAEIDQAWRGPFQSFARPALEHLAWAFFLARPVRHLTLALEGGTFDSHSGWSEPGGDEFRLCLHRSTTVLDWLIGLAAASREHVLLNERCAFAPIPIWLGGRLLNDPDRLDRWIPQGSLSPPSFFQFTPFPYSLSEILVERNLLRTSGPQLLASLPTMRTVRQLRVGNDDYELMTRTLEQNLRLSHVQGVHLSQWLHEGPEWSLSSSEKPEPDSYPLARARGLASSEKVLAVSSEVMAPFVSQIPARLPFPFNQQSTWANRNTRNFERNLPRVSMRLTLPLAMHGPALLVPLQDGVTLDPLVGPFSLPGLVVLAAVDGLSPDLSQLKPVYNEVFERLVGEVRAQAQEMFEDFWSVAHETYPDWVLDHIRKAVEAAK